MMNRATNRKSELERMIEELSTHLVDNGRTIEEEYKLVEQKQSKLSKRMREFVVIAYAMEQAKEHEATGTAVNDQITDAVTTKQN